MSVIKRMLEEKRLGRPIQWDRDRILALLEVSDKAVGRALMRIHKNQVIDENTKQPGPGLGWNRADKAEMERIVKQLNLGYKLAPGQLKYLRGYDMNMPRPRLGKYWRQLLKAANDKRQGKLI